MGLGRLSGDLVSLNQQNQPRKDTPLGGGFPPRSARVLRGWKLTGQTGRPSEDEGVLPNDCFPLPLKPIPQREPQKRHPKISVDSLGGFRAPWIAAVRHEEFPLLVFPCHSFPRRSSVPIPSPHLFFLVSSQPGGLRGKETGAESEPRKRVEPQSAVLGGAHGLQRSAPEDLGGGGGVGAPQNSVAFRGRQAAGRAQGKVPGNVETIGRGADSDLRGGAIKSFARIHGICFWGQLKPGG